MKTLPPLRGVLFSPYHLFIFLSSCISLFFLKFASFCSLYSPVFFFSMFFFFFPHRTQSRSRSYFNFCLILIPSRTHAHPFPLSLGRLLSSRLVTPFKRENNLSFIILVCGCEMYFFFNLIPSIPFPLSSWPAHASRRSSASRHFMKCLNSSRVDVGWES